MFSDEKMAELKRNSELILEFIEIVDDLNTKCRTLEKDKKYYMDEYKKVSDSLRDMRRQKENQGNNKSTIIKCKDKSCFHNSNGICQCEEIEVNIESICLLSERNPMSEC